jgi:hypothetical protein
MSKKAEQQARQASSLLFPFNQLKFGSKIATLDGDVGLITKGTHVAQKWAVDAL